jgi:hypothetical protein
MVERGRESHVFSARRYAAAAAALLLIAAAFALFSGARARAENAPRGCEAAVGFTYLPSPIVPWTGAPLRILVVTDKPLAGELSLIAPNGGVAARSRERHGGPPYFWHAEVKSPAAGTWRATLASDHAPAGCGTITREIAVRADRPPPPQAAAGGIWALRNTWNRATEDLYSAWIAKLFDAPPDVEQSWPAMHFVLRDAKRNFLFDYLGLGEDQMGLVYRPDCADFPYFMRAYFAFKMGLPFAYSSCTRGFGGKPPRCTGWSSILNAAAEQQQGLVPTFARYLRTVADGVQSGNGRTLASDDRTDFYPVPLTQETLRPGTIYADPYGHFLTLVRRVPQAGGKPGVFLAVDAEPDGTVTRKRFWRGNFLFVHDPALGGPGFKRFRPIVREENGGLRPLSNREIAKNPQYGDFSLEQSKFSEQAFYDRMDDVMSPAPLDPARAMEDAITSLEEQVKTRVTAVENGRKYYNSKPGEIAMPDGAAIFATTGPWEDYSTPARDFRLLIAIDVVAGYPDRVARRAARYAMPEGKSVADVKAELQQVLASELAKRKISYTRSDGSAWTLSLKDVIDRTPDYEMAYNPNDCVELRWGAPAQSEEASSCKLHAPSAQRAKMTKYRPWFHQRHWPAHS